MKFSDMARIGCGVFEVEKGHDDRQPDGEDVVELQMGDIQLGEEDDL